MLYVIDTPSSYNVIFIKDWLIPYKAICYSYHLMMKFPTKHGIAKV